MNKESEFYNQYWTDFYGWSPNNINLSRFETKFFQRHVAAGAFVIEFGCGDCSHYGDFIIQSQTRYVGLDISRVATRGCRDRGLVAIVHDLQKHVPFSDNSSDLVLCIEVLEHLFDPETALHEMYRVLKPGGVALITVPNITSWSNRLLFLLGIFNPGGSPVTSLKEPWKDPHIRFFTASSLFKIIRKVGFTEINIEGEFSLAYLPIVYRKRGLRYIADVISLPLRPLGRYWPSLFAHRLFVTAKKPGAV